MIDTFALAADYAALGYDPIPLRAGAKEPLRDGWQRLDATSQWLGAPASANIGLRGGGSLRAAFLDCDDPETWEVARRWAAGLGYMPDGDYPLVATAHDRRHVYLRLADSLPGHWKRLRRDFGRGELRFGPASYVVGPGSVVDGREYRLLAGDLRQLPRLERQDLAQVADVETGPVLRVADSPTVPRLASAILRGDAATIGRYASRSEADAACLTALVNAGYDFAGVLVLFQTSPGSGKYAELRQRSERDALRYLRHQYDRCAAWAEAHESTGRRAAREALAGIMAQPWPGRTGRSDWAVARSHCEIAFRCGRMTYQASIREIAERAGVGVPAALRANRRLVEAGFLTLEAASFATAAAAYTLQKCKVITLPNSPPVRECYHFALHDAFRYRGLGKSAAHVWAILRDRPGLTVAELAERTGRNVATVRRVLGRMARIVDTDTGEVYRLVERDGDGWRAVDGDLDAIARAIGTAGAGAKQRARHTEQRAGYARAIARAQAGTTPEREKI